MRGVFSQTTEKPRHEKPVNHYKIGHSIKMQTAKDILDTKFTQQLISAIEPLTGLPADYFKATYLKLLSSYAAYATVFPKKINSGLGSLYSNSLYGAYHTLKTFVEDKPIADCLWRFAVFSAALLKRCNVLAQSYQVIITDQNGAYTKHWNPFSGPLENHDGTYCKLYTQGNVYHNNYAILMGMIVAKLMPTDMLAWLQTNGNLFAQWLDCLQSEVDVAGILGEALKVLLIDEDLIAENENELTVELIETPETAAGEALNTWIKEGIADGSIKVNTPDAHIHIISDGLSDAMFVDPGVAKNFTGKLATYSTSMAAAVAMFYALFGPNQQHTLALTHPGLTKRSSSFMGGGAADAVRTTLRNAHGLDASAYFAKNHVLPASQYAKTTQPVNKALNAIKSILNKAQQSVKKAYHTGLGR